MTCEKKNDPDLAKDQNWIVMKFPASYLRSCAIGDNKYAGGGGGHKPPPHVD